MSRAVWPGSPLPEALEVPLPLRQALDLLVDHRILGQGAMIMYTNI